MRNFDPTLISKLEKLVIGTFYLLEFQFPVAGTKYYTDSDIPIFHEGNKYTPIDFTFGDIVYTNNMNVDTVEITVNNLNKAFSAMVLGEDVRNKVVIISFGVILQDDDTTYVLDDSVSFGYESGGSTLANTRLSLADGNAFFDVTTQDINYPNSKINVYNKTPYAVQLAGSNVYPKITGYIKEAGTGETFGSELITGWGVNDGYGPFTVSGNAITSAVSSVGAKAYSNIISVVAGKAYKLTATLTLNSGQAPTVLCGTGGIVAKEINSALSAGANTIYFTATETATRYLWMITTAPTNYACTFALSKILLPATSGY